MNPGQNTIPRRSTDSSVTIPFERTFRNLDQNRPNAGTTEEAEFNFCGCGWPQHMLVPKGLPGGLACELFVMISDYEQDRVRLERKFCIEKLFFRKFIHRSIKTLSAYATMQHLSVEYVIVCIRINVRWVSHSIVYRVLVRIECRIS